MKFFWKIFENLPWFRKFLQDEHRPSSRSFFQALSSSNCEWADFRKEARTFASADYWRSRACCSAGSEHNSASSRCTTFLQLLRSRKESAELAWVTVSLHNFIQQALPSSSFSYCFSIWYYRSLNCGCESTRLRTRQVWKSSRFAIPKDFLLMLLSITIKIWSKISE